MTMKIKYEKTMKKKNDVLESALSAEPANESIATSKREREKSIAYAAILTAAEAAEKAAAFFRCVFMVKLFPFTIVF